MISLQGISLKGGKKCFLGTELGTNRYYEGTFSHFSRVEKLKGEKIRNGSRKPFAIDGGKK